MCARQPPAESSARLGEEQAGRTGIWAERPSSMLAQEAPAFWTQTGTWEEEDRGMFSPIRLITMLVMFLCQVGLCVTYARNPNQTVSAKRSQWTQVTESLQRGRPRADDLRGSRGVYRAWLLLAQVTPFPAGWPPCRQALPQRGTVAVLSGSSAAGRRPVGLVPTNRPVAVPETLRETLTGLGPGHLIDPPEPGT